MIGVSPDDPSALTTAISHVGSVATTVKGAVRPSANVTTVCARRPGRPGGLLCGRHDMSIGHDQPVGDKMMPEPSVTLTAQIGLQFDDAGQHLCGNLLDRVGARAGLLGRGRRAVARCSWRPGANTRSDAATPPIPADTTAIASRSGEERHASGKLMRLLTCRGALSVPSGAWSTWPGERLLGKRVPRLGGHFAASAGGSVHIASRIPSFGVRCR